MADSVYEITLPTGETYQISSPHELGDNELGSVVYDAQKPATHIKSPAPTQPTSQPAQQPGQYDHYKVLGGFAQQHGFTVTGANETSGHNVNSPHYEGRAVDVRVRDKTTQQVDEFIKAAQDAGIKVVDERAHPAGQPVWSGPHIHLEAPRNWNGLSGTTKKYTDYVVRNNPLPNPPSILEQLQPNQPNLTKPQTVDQQLEQIGVKSQPNILDKFKKQQQDWQSTFGNQSSTQVRKDVDGTIENAMTKIDGILGKKISTSQRTDIKNFLLASGGNDSITSDQVQTALQLAGKGKFNWLRDPQKVVSELPFSLGELSTKRLQSKQGVKNLTVDTREGGEIPVGMANRMAANKFNVPVEALDHMIGAFAKSSAYETVPLPKEDQLNPVDQLIADSVPNNKAGIYASDVGAALSIFPKLLQDAAGQALGRERGATITDEDIQNNPVGRIGTLAFQFGKYLTPGGHVAVGADLANILGQATDVGLPKAAGQAAKGFEDSINFLDPSVDTIERVGRGINAAFLGYGLTHGATSAWKAGDRAIASNELAQKLDINKWQAYKLLSEAEQHATNYVLAMDSAMGKNPAYSAHLTAINDQAQTEANKGKAPTFKIGPDGNMYFPTESVIPSTATPEVAKPKQPWEMTKQEFEDTVPHHASIPEHIDSMLNEGFNPDKRLVQQTAHEPIGLFTGRKGNVEGRYGSVSMVVLPKDGARILKGEEFTKFFKDHPELMKAGTGKELTDTLLKEGYDAIGSSNPDSPMSVWVNPDKAQFFANQEAVIRDAMKRGETIPPEVLAEHGISDSTPTKPNKPAETSKYQIVEVAGQRLKVELSPEMLSGWKEADSKYRSDRASMHDAYRKGDITDSDKQVLEKFLLDHLKTERRKITGYLEPHEASAVNAENAKLKSGDEVSVRLGDKTINATVARLPFGVDQQGTRIRVRSEDGKSFTVTTAQITKIDNTSYPQAKFVSHEGYVTPPAETPSGLPSGPGKMGAYPEHGRELAPHELDENHPSNFYHAGEEGFKPQEPKPAPPKQPLSRNWKRGSDINAKIVFDSELQKDLFDIGASKKMGGKNAGSMSHGQQIKDRVESAVKRYGLTDGEAHTLGTLTYNDVREQMSQVEDGETKKVTDNIQKPSDLKTRQKYSEPKTQTTKTPKTSNKVFTDDARAAALARIKWRKGNTNFLADPTSLADWLIVGGHYVEQGVRSFAAFSKEMIADLGNEVKDYLPLLYNKAHEQLGIKPTEKVAPSRVSNGNRPPSTIQFDPSGLIGKTPVMEMVNEKGATVYMSELGKTLTPNSKTPLMGMDTVIKPALTDLAHKYADLTDQISKLYRDGDIDNAKQLEARRKYVEADLRKEIDKALPGGSQALRDKYVAKTVLEFTTDPAAVMSYVREKANGTLTPKQAAQLEQLATRRSDVFKSLTNMFIDEVKNLKASGHDVTPQEMSAMSSQVFNKFRLETTGDTNKILRVIIDSQKDSIIDTATSFWKATLLASVRNPLMNAKANILDSAGLSLSRVPRGLIDAALGHLTGQRTREINIQSPLKGIREALSKEVFDMMKGAVTGKLTPTDLAKLDLPHRSHSQLGSLAGAGEGNFMDTGLDWMTNTVFGMVQAFDKPFIKVAYQRSIEEQARLIARRGEKLSGQAYTKRYKELLASPTDAMKLQGYADAEYATLASKNAVAEAIQSGKLRLKASENIGSQVLYAGSNVVMPFTKVPLNAATRGLEFSGGGIIHGGVKLADYVFKGVRDNKASYPLKDAIKKTFEDMPADLQREVSDSVGNGMTGLGLMVLGTWMYRKGVMRPFRPNTEEQRNRNEALGQTNGAVNLLGHDVDITDSYVGRMLAFGATYQALNDGAFNDKDGNPDTSGAVMAGIGGITKNPLSDTNQTVDQLIQNPTTFGAQWLKNLYGSATSVAFTAELAKLGAGDINPVTERGLGGLTDIQKSRLPILRGQMQPKTDALGNVTHRSWLEYATNSTANVDNPVAKELDSLNISITKPSRAKKNTAKYGGESGVDGRFDRSEIDYQDRVAFVGYKVRETLSQIVSDPDFKTHDAKYQSAMLREVVAGIKKGANEELDGLRMTQGYESAHKYVWDLVSGKRQPE